MVISHSAQPGLLESKLLINHTRWVLNLGPDVLLLPQKPAARAVSTKSNNFLLANLARSDTSQVSWQPGVLCFYTLFQLASQFLDSRQTP